MGGSGDWGFPTILHTATDTPESLRPRLDRLGDRVAPGGGAVYAGPSTSSHTTGDTTESLRSCLGRRGYRDAPWVCCFHPASPPHNDGNTRVPPAPPGPVGGQGRPRGHPIGQRSWITGKRLAPVWGSGTPGPSAFPTQRHMHPVFLALPGPLGGGGRVGIFSGPLEEAEATIPSSPARAV